VVVGTVVVGPVDGTLSGTSGPLTSAARVAGRGNWVDPSFTVSVKAGGPPRNA
jgi:hypothetical protein